MTTRLANWMFQWMFMCVTRTSWKFEADDGSPRFMPEDAIVLWVCMCLLLLLLVETAKLMIRCISHFIPRHLHRNWQPQSDRQLRAGARSTVVP